MSGAGQEWRDVSSAHPCPICDGDSWCSVSGDGAVASCRRKAEGAFVTKCDKNGSPVYVHRLRPSFTPRLIRPVAIAVPCAAPEDLNEVYYALLGELRLSDRHREELRERGLTDAAIDAREYRSMPKQGLRNVASSLFERFADRLYHVPGFFAKAEGSGSRPKFNAAPGLLIPVRNRVGLIVALRVRRETSEDGGSKYVYVSSVRFGGPGPGAPIHVPLASSRGAVEVVRLTEGELKADVATELSGILTISAPGVTNWRPAIPILHELCARTLVLAFDMDVLTKEQVARALRDCFLSLKAEGFDVCLERWSLDVAKGIDDLLRSGGQPEMLRDQEADAAVQAIAGSLPVEVDAVAPLGGMHEVLRQDGAAGLLRNEGMLRALAQLSKDDPQEFAAVKATLRGQVPLQDLGRALRPFQRELAAASDSSSPDMFSSSYCIVQGWTVREKMTNDGPTTIQLANFSARIVGEVVIDDGVETKTTLMIEGALASGETLPRVEVSGDDFPTLRWVVSHWGTRAVVLAGQSVKDHVRVAIQFLSGYPPRRTVYTHTGWRRIDAIWYYLSGSGAIGPQGLFDHVEVRLDDSLAKLELLEPPVGESLRIAAGASLALLDGLAPDSVMIPVLAAVFRAALGACDITVHLNGPSGRYKSEIAALCQQHYGAAMDARNLPASWLSTGNALEAIAFIAKDALLVVDDYVPGNGGKDRQKLQTEAARIIRAQGNSAGRQRSNVDGRLRQTRPPRGLLLSTGEEVPGGYSLRARIVVVDVNTGDVDLGRLTECQRLAAAGELTRSMSGFVSWLAPRYEDLRRNLKSRVESLRAELAVRRAHARTSTNVAQLLMAFDIFLEYARCAGAIDEEQHRLLFKRATDALLDLATDQDVHQSDADPAAQFLRLLIAALNSGRVCFAGPDGRAPKTDASAWGWRSDDHGLIARSRLVGWVDGDDLYLEPEAAFAEAQSVARDQGELIAVAPRTLHQRLRDEGHLASTGSARGRVTIRRTLAGVVRSVLHLPAALVVARNVPNVPPDEEQTQGTGAPVFEVTTPPETASPSGSEAAGVFDLNSPSEKDLGTSGRLGRFSGGIDASSADGDRVVTPHTEWETL